MIAAIPGSGGGGSEGPVRPGQGARTTGNATQEGIVRPGNQIEWGPVQPPGASLGIVVPDSIRFADARTLGLGDPRGPLPAMVAPQLSFRMPGGQRAGFAEIIRPQSGMILLHPGWQPRGERFYEGDGQRLVIEFELAAPV